MLDMYEFLIDLKLKTCYYLL